MKIDDMIFPYKILLEKKDLALEQLYLDVSSTTDTIIPFSAVKETFNPDNYQVKTYKWQELKLSKCNLSTIHGISLQRIKDDAMLREGKQYVELTKEDVKELFSLELYREQQLNKILPR